MSDSTRGEERLLPIEDITVDPDVQDRADLSEETIKEYAASDLTQFPPVRVWHLDDGVLLLSAGHHTLAAHDEAGKPEVRALVFQGTKADAILDAVRSNTRHGLRRSGKDKRRAAGRLLQTFPDWSNERIAAEAQVDDELVESVRKELTPAHVPVPGRAQDLGKRTDASGRKQPATREDADRQREWIRSLLKKDPTRTGRDVAEEVGCSSRTVDIEKKRMRVVAAIDAGPGQAAPKVLCVRCQRVGAVTGCTQCQEGEREPGDDTEAEEKARKAEKAARKRNGKEVVGFDWKGFEGHLGGTVRGVDDLARAFPAWKNTPDYRGSQNLLREFGELMKRTRKALGKK